MWWEEVSVPFVTSLMTRFQICVLQHSKKRGKNPCMK